MVSEGPSVEDLRRLSPALSGTALVLREAGETFGSSTKTAKPFGAPDSDEGDDESGDDDDDDSQPEDSEKAEKENTEKDDAKAVEEKKKKLQMGKCCYPFPPLFSASIPLCLQLLKRLSLQSR
jgi:cobalamin biosynthesis protein CobT